MTHREKALHYFSEKFHCSQSVIAAYAEDCGITEGLALKMGACFGSGMRKGEVCGACVGALMTIGLIYGQTEKGDLESRQICNRLNEALLDRFRAANGSYLCNDLLQCDISTTEGRNYAVENDLFTSFCPKMVASAVDILEELLKEEEYDNGTA